ncbi:MAG: Phosphoribosylglycinamide formyltransferase [Candidatus Argoarchaeum ethanivorans]|uniref:phosphoribosylglycinamide formyltransferase 1 n=1 Tax=Candidatus Argoarchaeum ethanivorans TaxID=2608793 RepID=A0A811TEF2_9EURY|nr:MAG: Phosphoribosylglycinamide formyltransferase [Candidatus Argoarchaeum ethanivorans]
MQRLKYVILKKGVDLKKIAVLVSGRGSNLQAIIDNIESGYIKDAVIALVVSDVEDAYALTRAEKHGIKAVHVNPDSFDSRETYEKHILELLHEVKADLVLLAGYMRVIGSVLLDAYYGRMINIHPALLPAFQGLHAQEQAFNYGVKVSGCTVHFVDSGVDTGPIILERCVLVLEDDTPDSLADRILIEEHQIYSEAIKLFIEERLVIEGRKVRIKSL